MKFLWRGRGGSIVFSAIIVGVAVLSAQFTTIDEWKEAHFSAEQITAGLAADEAAPSGDGVSNLYKYALGLTPWDEPHPFLPSGGISADFLTLDYRFNPLAADIRYTVESSTDLKNWTEDFALGTQTEMAIMESGVIKMRYTDWKPFTAETNRFLRLKVERVDIPSDVDLDEDGMADSWEILYFGSIENGDASADSDGDGLTNREEYFYRINPRQQNSDGDELNDGQEIALARDPRVAKELVESESVQWLSRTEVIRAPVYLTETTGVFPKFTAPLGPWGVPSSPVAQEGLMGYEMMQIKTETERDFFNGSTDHSESTTSISATDLGAFVSYTWLLWNCLSAEAAEPLGGAITYSNGTRADTSLSYKSEERSRDFIIKTTVRASLSGDGKIYNRLITPEVKLDQLWRAVPPSGFRSIDGSDGSKYFFVCPSGMEGTVRWMIVFTPDENPENKSYQSLEWVIDGVKSPEFRLDPPPSPNGSYAAILYEASIAVDADRDGQIVADSLSNWKNVSVDRTSETKPHRFWVNDDDDNGDTNGGDRAVATNPAMNNGPANWQGDGSYFGVNGVRDLVDFFPVFLDLKQLLTVLPATTPGVKYKLKQADSALNFVYTGLTRANALSYQTQPTGAIYGPQFDTVVGQAQTHWITAEGVELSAGFLTRIQQQDQGVILIEGRKVTTQPLILAVEKDGTVIAEVKLELSIGSVEDMYRRINLRDGAEAPAGLVGDFSVRNADLGLPSSMGEPANFTDSLTNGKWFVFVVGSNVGGQKMRGWQSEVFKRMYWSQSKARFVGVSWYGDPYSDGNDLVYDYHSAARNAFTTAPVLTAKLNALAGTKTIAGHSAAALIISSAVTDHGLSVSSACLIDAAMARECFDGSSADDLTGMVPALWRDHPSAYWASHWHEAFGAADARSTLTWRNRFSGAASVVHNFYSSTEDVLGRYDGTVNGSIIENLRAPGSFAWVIQEKAKGDKLNILGLVHGGSDYGGWGFNRKDPLFEGDGIHWKWDPSRGRMPKTAAELGTISTTILRRYPVFEPGWGKLGFNERLLDTAPSEYTGPSWIFDLYGATAGNALAVDPVKRSQILNEAIPALSLAVGSNATLAFEERNYNLPSQYADAARWPSVRGVVSGVPVWRHSDMREVAYLYLARFYDKLSSLANQ